MQMNLKLPPREDSYQSLVKNINHALSDARAMINRGVNGIMIDTYWHIGRYIVEFEQQGKERAEYGSKLLNRLSVDLSKLYGRGFSKSNLHYIRKFL